MKMSLSKKTCSSVLSALMLTSAVAAAPTVACADPVDDSGSQDDVSVCSTVNHSYKFDLEDNEKDGTGYYEKEDDSSTYVGVSKITGSMRLYVDGANKKSAEGKNCTINGYAVAPGKGNWRIMNKVYEKGYKYAKLGAWANDGDAFLKGVWSADCAGSYTTINH